MCIFVGLQDGNGIITFEEFITLIDGLETAEKNDKEARDAFNAFDFTGQGFIPSLDIKVSRFTASEWGCCFCGVL